MVPRVPALPPNLPEFLFILGVGSVIWYAAILSIPILLLLARRIHTRRTLIIAGAALFAALFLATAFVDYLITYRGISSRPPLLPYFTVALRQHLVPWIAVAAIVAAVEMRRRGRRSRLEIAEQRLVALTGQLQPHFLFNTLQGISTLIHRDPAAADEMLSRLSDLLRDLLRHRASPLVKLDDELRYIRTYLEISKFRFADRLTYAIESDPSVGETKVPLFILQPLVENALDHGIGKRAEGGVIIVRAERTNGNLRLDVEDNGGGMRGNEHSDGVGITNTRERLRASFGSRQHFHIASNDRGGVTARIEIPLA
jgi:LytS/YehU family sensor histidine kinase